MKWNKAVDQIEQALAAGKAVSVRYHRKWMKQDEHFDKVYSVSRYVWNGQPLNDAVAVNTYYDQLLISSHIIDEVIIEER